MSFTRCRYENGVPLMQGMTSFWMLRQWDYNREPSALTIERIQWLFDAGFIHREHAAQLLKGTSLAEVLTLRTVVAPKDVVLH